MQTSFDPYSHECVRDRPPSLASEICQRFFYIRKFLYASILFAFAFASVRWLMFASGALLSEFLAFNFLSEYRKYISRYPSLQPHLSLRSFQFIL